LGKRFSEFKKGGCFSPYNFDIYFHLGQTSDQMKDYDGAVNSYLKAISLHPYFIEAENNLGAVYIKLDYLMKPVEEFRRAIEINPYHPDYTIILATSTANEICCKRRLKSIERR